MIINLTQHPTTDEQRAAGVVDLPDEQRAALREALTFDRLPDYSDVLERAKYIASLAVFNGLGGDGEDPVPLYAMIGGAPYLMAPLERALQEHSIIPVYAFSVRESVEAVQPDGSIVKRSVFRHRGFVACAKKT